MILDKYLDYICIYKCKLFFTLPYLFTFQNVPRKLRSSQWNRKMDCS